MRSQLTKSDLTSLSRERPSRESKPSRWPLSRHRDRSRLNPAHKSGCTDTSPRTLSSAGGARGHPPGSLNDEVPPVFSMLLGITGIARRNDVSPRVKAQVFLVGGDQMVPVHPGARELCSAIAASAGKEFENLAFKVF